MEMYRKRQATAMAEEDRISELPDCIIHDILSFLPSTKQAIQTSILSKRWRNQWTRIPVLRFDESTGISSENFIKFVDNTLIRHHNSSNIKKLHLEYPYSVKKDPLFDSKIHFATRKHVEELYLSSYYTEDSLLLPQFFFDTASSLVKLTAIHSIVMPHGKVNWGCLTALKMENCKLADKGLQHILSGSPLLESLELIKYSELDKPVIASKSMKKLVLRHNLGHVSISAIEILCPNLVELSLVCLEVVGDANLFGQAFANFLSTSPLLESLELIWIDFPLPHDQLVIASKSLKKLAISSFNNILNLHVSCPQLEILVLYGWFNLRTSKLLDLPSSLCATFDFCHYGNNISIRKTVVKDILQQLHHVKQLTIGGIFINILSTLGVGDPFPSVLNVKRLILKSPNLNNNYSGIARLLRHAPELEKLVINMPTYDQTKLETLDDFGENFWNPDDGPVFNCLVAHLKIVKIISFPNSDYEFKFLMSFVQFLLNNARVLEKMIVISKDSTNKPSRISNKLLDLPRCSKHAIVELIYS